MHLAPALRGQGIGLLMIRSVMIQHPGLPLIGKAAPATPTPWGDPRPGPKEWRKASRSLAAHYKKLGFVCHPTGEGDFLIFRPPFLGVPRRDALLKLGGFAGRHDASGGLLVDHATLLRLRGEIASAGAM